MTEPPATATVITGPPPDPLEDLRTAGPPQWKPSGEHRDIRYEVAEGIAKITICRPEVRNAFRPQTLFELSAAFGEARDDPEVGAVILTGEGPDAFCSGGDQRIRGDDGYLGDDDVAGGGSGDSTCSISRSRSGGCPSPSWPWWPGTPSAAATSSISSAT